MKRLILILVMIMCMPCWSSVYHVKSATHNNDPDTTGTPDNSSAPYGLQGALDNVSAGDEIRIWADGTYNIAVTLTVDGTTGTDAAWIMVNGANATGTVDGTHCTLIATAELTNGMIQFNNDATNYYVFRYVTMDGDADGGTHATYCVYNNDDNDGQGDIRFRDCRFTDAIADGVYWAGSAWEFVNCEADLCGDCGFQADAADGAFSLFIGCSSHDNTGHGFYFDGGGNKVLFCLAYANGADGMQYEAAADDSCCVNCTINGNGSDGIFIDTGADDVSVINTTSCNNTVNGFNLDSDGTHIGYFAYNHANGNAAETDVGGTWATFGNGSNQDGAPAFTSVVNGQEDFTPGSGSDLIGNGFPGTINDQSSGTHDGSMDIGALQISQAGGGGGQPFNEGFQN